MLEELDLQRGDGMCMGIHGWREGNFGKHPPPLVAEAASTKAAVRIRRKRAKR